MVSNEQSIDDDKPLMPAGLKKFNRIVSTVTLLMFIAPSVYLMKYYVFDKPREDAIISRYHNNHALPLSAGGNPDYVPLLIDISKNDGTDNKGIALRALGKQLTQPYASLRRPMESFMGKVALSDIAANEKDIEIKKTAQEALEKVLQTGVVIKR